LLEPPQPLPEILNLTAGAISDEVARRWVIADLRRGMGDQWAACHLRADIVDADVLGPPGLNGTKQSILENRAKGVIGQNCRPASFVTIAAAVVAVSEGLQFRLAEAGLTNFVIVQTLQATGKAEERIFADGHRESIGSFGPAGTLIWQLDTGQFRDLPIVGPLWYQARGWRCHPDGTSPLDEICALLRPDNR
jgi:hypothetical protein